jgi:hypothetical protein
MQGITFFFVDEAWIHFSGLVNTQNYGTWSAHVRHNVIEVPLYPIKIDVLVAMSQRILQQRTTISNLEIGYYLVYAPRK